MPSFQTDLPSPFYHAKDINEVHEYFSTFATEMGELSKSTRNLKGDCFVCKQEVVFTVDVPVGGSPVNWRETLTCPQCKLINRWRSCLHVFEAICTPTVESRIYLTETLSPVFQNLAGRYPLLSSSEYFPNLKFGEVIQISDVSVRNEDVTKLSFDDDSFEIILCFDVLEHVPDYRAALKEFFRVLDTGGQLVISVPFSFQQLTVVRAKLDDAGNIEHFTEPCYHGDPLSDQGVLSYYDFGMELLDELQKVGFKECFLVCYYSKEWAYTNKNIVFIARKPKPSIKQQIMAKLAWLKKR